MALSNLAVLSDEQLRALGSLPLAQRVGPARASSPASAPPPALTLTLQPEPRHPATLPP